VKNPRVGYNEACARRSRTRRAIALFCPFGRSCLKTNLVRESDNSYGSDEAGPEKQARAERLSACPASNTDHNNV
jgi:hypothetical protein